jgi:DNA-binding NarL/FixJ family response regulator
VEPPAARAEHPRISVLIASGDRPVLRMVNRFLATSTDVIVVGLAHTMPEAAERIAALNPDVLLLDHNLMAPLGDIAWAQYRRQLLTEVIALVDSTPQLHDANAFPLVVTKSRLADELMPCICRAAVLRASRSGERDAARRSTFSKDSQ